MKLKHLILSLLLSLSAACDNNSNSKIGVVVKLDSIATQSGLELFEPVAIQIGDDRSIFVLDRGNGELYRISGNLSVDTIAKKGAGPGELQGPTSFALLGDSAVIVSDDGNARIQVIPLRGGAVRTYQFSQGAHTGIFDPFGQRFYAASYGQNFELVDGNPVVKQESLISILSTESGEIIGYFGIPRRYEGKVLPIFGNMVRLARDPRNGDVWVAWPLEPIMERFSERGERKDLLKRSLTFEPPPPTEEQTTRSPLPVGDFQQVTFDVQVDSRGRLFILTPVAAKKHNLQSQDYRPPAQAIEVLREDGVLECRINLPVTGTSFSVVDDNEIFLIDLRETGEVYRIRYRCPS